MSDVPYKYLKDDGELFYPITGPSSFREPVPISKGGTGATNAADARAALGITGGSPVLLWTNASPASAFAEQTVQLDLSAYSFVMIEYMDGEYVSRVKTALFPVPTITPPTGYACYNQIVGIAQSGSAVRLCYRDLTVSASGVAFHSGVWVDDYGNENTVNDYYCKPWRIWGLK